MTIMEQLTADMKQAMKDREAGRLRLSVIRMARGDIRKAEIDGKKTLTDQEAIAVLMKGVKMRNDSLAEFTRAGREDLIEQTKAELEILQKYLPKAMTDEELNAAVQEAIAEVGATSLKDMGKVMKAAVAKAAGRADGKRINATVKALLAK